MSPTDDTHRSERGASARLCQGRSRKTKEVFERRFHVILYVFECFVRRVRSSREEKRKHSSRSASPYILKHRRVSSAVTVKSCKSVKPMKQWGENKCGMLISNVHAQKSYLNKSHPLKCYIFMAPCPETPHCATRRVHTLPAFIALPVAGNVSAD